MPSKRSLPAIAPSCALLAGVLSSAALTVSAVPTAALAIVAALALAASRKRLARVAACAALFCGGVMLDRNHRTGARERAEACFPASAAAERSIEGIVDAVPEADAAGERWFDLHTSLPVCGHRGAGLSLRIRVAPSPPESGAVVDALGAGDRVRLWCRLQRPRGYRNPGSPDPAEVLRIAGLDAYGYVKSARLVEPLARGGPGPRRLTDALKRVARHRLDRALGPGGADRALAGAILLGDRRAMDPATRRLLRDSGLAHLVAISGLHVGWLTLLVVGALRRGRVKAPLVLLLCVILTATFVQLVGARPSVLRAGIAAAAVLFARSIGRDGAPLNSLALIAAALVACDPAIARDAGFQLSFAATAGILRLAPAIARRSGIPGRWALGPAVSLAAYLATSPLVALHLGRQAPVALIANLAGVPLAGLLLLSGYGTIGLAGVPLLGDVCSACANFSCEALLRLAAFVSGLPGGAFAVAPPGWFTLAVYYPLLASAAGRNEQPERRPPLAVARASAAAAAFLAVVVHAGPPPAPPGTMEVSVIDVGQGQAVAVRSADGRAVLIDAGGAFRGAPDPGERVVVPHFLRAGIRRLELLILSHEDLDHAGGALAVVRDLEVGEVWMGPRALRQPRMREVAAEVRRRGGAVTLAERGTGGTPAGLITRVLSPARETVPRHGNDDSVVVLLGTPPARILIPGDLEAAGETALLEGDRTLEAEAVVLSHHGSRSGTSAEFLARVRPRVAIASAGRGNRFGHPHPDVQRRLAVRRIPLWNTARDGGVRLIAGPGGWQVEGSVDRVSGE